MNPKINKEILDIRDYLREQDFDCYLHSTFLSLVMSPQKMEQFIEHEGFPPKDVGGISNRELGNLLFPRGEPNEILNAIKKSYDKWGFSFTHENLDIEQLYFRNANERRIVGYSICGEPSVIASFYRD